MGGGFSKPDFLVTVTVRRRRVAHVSSMPTGALDRTIPFTDRDAALACDRPWPYETSRHGGTLRDGGGSYAGIKTGAGHDPTWRIVVNICLI